MSLVRRETAAVARLTTPCRADGLPSSPRNRTLLAEQAEGKDAADDRPDGKASVADAKIAAGDADAKDLTAAAEKPAGPPVGAQDKLSCAVVKDAPVTGLMFAVVGCGHLGQRVAMELACLGATVFVFDPRVAAESVRPTIAGLSEEMASVLQGAVGMDPEAAQTFINQTLGRIHGTQSIKDAVARAGIVSECVADNLGIKQQVLVEIERYCAPHCLVTTNTLTIELAKLQEGRVRPNNVLGMRFLWPVLFIPFIEISVLAAQQDQGDQLRAMVQALGKLCFDGSIETSHSGFEPFSIPDLLPLRQSRLVNRNNRFRLLDSEAARYQAGEAQVRFASTTNGYQPASECIVCYDGPCEALIVACGHRVLCMACASILVQTRQSCPLCRASMHGRTVHISEIPNSRRAVRKQEK